MRLSEFRVSVCRRLSLEVAVLAGLTGIAAVLAFCASAHSSDPREIRVHAIAWHSDPTRRIVVINNHVLHEGEVGGELTVLEIQRASVVLLRGGKRILVEVQTGRPGDAPERDAPKEEAGESGSAEPSVSRQAEGRTMGEACASADFECTASLARVRAAPGQDAPVLETISRGTLVQVTGREGNWIRLRLRDGSFGWIHESLVRER